MIEFLIKVLASNLFWAGYIIVSGIASIILMRKGPYHWLALLTKDSKSAYAVVEKYGQEMVEKGEQDMKRFKAIISSMTPKERIYPKVLNRSRKERIAKGTCTGSE